MSARIALAHLSADALGLARWERKALAERPRPASLPGMLLPDVPEVVPEAGAALEPEQRAELARSLEENLARFEPHVAVIESVRALEREDTWFVVAGQQPGLLGGPLYDVYKALTAIRLARALSTAGRKVLPAFWNHADDHDIGEVNSLWIQNPNLDLRKLGLAGMGSGRTPLSLVRFDEETHRIAALGEVLRQNLWRCDELEPALELFLPRDGESFSNAFTRVLLALFGHHGLVVIEPDWVRTPLSHALSRIVSDGLRDALEEGGADLRAAGGEPAIDPATAALCFRLVDGRRNALRFAGDEFRYDDESGARNGIELAAEIVQAPEAWSAGALLRPLVQDLALPVVAYVGGWGELAYHAQLPRLRERAGVPTTAFVPRLSATIVDPATRASLEKLGLSAREALAARGALGTEEVEDGPESPVAASLREIARESAARLLGEKAALAEVDRGLAQQLKKTADQIQGLVDKLAGKADRVHANASGRGRRHHRRIDNGLFPRGTPQERVRGALEFVARWGPGWIDQLLEEIEPLPTEHVVVTLEEEEA